MFPNTYFRSAFILALLILPILLSAQKNKGSIEGFVVDAKTKQPLDYATISVFNQKDSSLLTGGITDVSGKFFLEVPDGDFYLELNYLSYRSFTTEVIHVFKKNRKHQLAKIELTAATTTLSEVEVLSEKGEVQMSLEKRVFNVGSDITSAGGSALEVLDNVPSVTVDPNGKVSLRGNSNVQILVNGKPSALVGNGSAEGLKRLQAAGINSVEVITSPSAKYQADGAAGIINIILKKNKKAGVNGSLSATLGYNLRLGASADLNYRKDKLNFFLNYNFSYQDRPGISYFDHQFEKDGLLRLSEMDGDHGRIDISNSITGGMDFYFNEKNILTGSILYDRTGRDYFATLNYSDFTINKNNPIANTIRTDDLETSVDYFEYALTYKKTFEKKGQSLEFDVRFQEDKETRNSDFLNIVNNGITTNNIQQHAYNYETSSRWLASMDHTLPLGNGGKWEAGFQSSIRQISNDYLVEELTDASWNVIRGFDNEFIYKENIHALYSTLGGKKEKLSYQFGLRMEYSDISTELLRTNFIYPRENTQLFPSGHFSYQLKNDNALKISYSRRIRRPGFWDLNPFFLFVDDRNFFSGNPDLDPAYTNAYELSHIKYWEKGSLNSAIYYKNTTDAFGTIRLVDENGFTNAKPYNLNFEKQYGIEFSGSWNPSKVFRVTSNFNFYHFKTDGTNFNPDYLVEAFSWTGRLSPKIKLNKNWNFQCRINYRGERQNLQGKRLAYAYADLGLNRTILNKKGKLTFNVSDVFNSRRIDQVVESEGFRRDAGYQYYRRSLILNFSYKL